MKKLLVIISCLMLFFSKRTTAQVNNIDLEASVPGVYSTSNAINGWTISSQTITNCNTSPTWIPGSPEFSVLATPLLNFPFIGNIPNSPLGGNNIARLNNSTANNLVTKLTNTIAVSYSTSVLQVAFAAIFDEGIHPCCEQAGLKILFYNSSGNLITCPSYSYSAGNCSSSFGFSVTGNTKWTNWQLNYIELSPYIGTSITMEIIANDCVNGDHFCTALFDARINPPSFCWLCDYPPNSAHDYNPVSYCPGSSIATIQAPYGYTQYLWTAPAGYPISQAQSSLSMLTVTNPIIGNIYTLQATPPNVANCIITQTYALNTTSVSIMGIASSSSCVGGSSGSGTVIANGSSNGYSYTWLNSSNQIVGVNSIVNGLSPGTYSVLISAVGTMSCGLATAAIIINTIVPQVVNMLKPFCQGQNAYFSLNNGSNYQWYNNMTAISAGAGGTVPNYTITNPINGSIYRVTYDNSWGCKDSIAYHLTATNPGSLMAWSTASVCPGASNGNAIISMTPALGSPVGNNSFHVFSIGNTPAYSASVSPNPSTAFTANNLVAGQTYSVHASDGNCNYTTSFSVKTLNFDYNLGPPSQTICSGSSLAVGVNFTFPALSSGYTYSWSPTTFFGNNPGIFHFTSITPTTAPGSSSTFIYSVTVTPTIMNCPLTKTLAITVINLVTPSISAIPALCHNSSNYTVPVNPSGGIFLNNSNLFLGTTSGVISPSLAVIGINTFTYVTSAASCSSSTTASFIVNSVPLTVSNTTQIFCGQTATLFASGADIYQWSNGNTNSSFTAAPISTTIYTVTGISTTNLCSETKTTQVSVTSSFVVSILGSSTLCIGNTGALSATGANTYTWNSGAISPNILISPQISTSYSVTGSDILGCKSSTQIQVFVYSLPHPLVAGNFSICPGVETTLNAYNVYSFVWNTGATTNTILVSPSVTTIYTVTGIDFYGCKNTKTVTVMVSGCVGLEDHSQNTSVVSIYPNPNNGIFSIEAPGKINLLISDALGKVIFEKEFEQGHSSLNLSSYMNGIYFVKTTYKGETRTTKVIKNQ